MGNGNQEYLQASDELLNSRLRNSFVLDMSLLVHSAPFHNAPYQSV